MRITDFVPGLLIPTLTIMAFSVGLYLIRTRTAVKKLPNLAVQIILGVIFGVISIYAMSTGAEINGIRIHVGNSIPICTGLIFGGWSGVISGVIGGIVRWMAVSWGAGLVTRAACAVGMVFAGLFAAFLKRYLFSGRRPDAIMGFVITSVMEVVHMLLIMMFGFKNPDAAFSILKAAVIPMTLANALAVMLVIMAVEFFTGGIRITIQDGKSLPGRIQKRLLGAFVIVFFGITFFTYTLQSKVAEKDTENLLRLSIDDVASEIEDRADENLLEIARNVAKDINAGGLADRNIGKYKDLYSINEINVINPLGIITQSTNPYFVGYNMDSGDQSKEFLVLLDGEITEYAQAFGKISYDSHITQKYAATVLDDGGFVQVAMNAEQLQNQLSAGFNDIAKNRHLKSEGYLFIIDRQGRVVSAPEKKSRYIGKPIAEVLGSGRKSLPVEDVLSRDTIAGEKAFAMYRTVGGYYVCAVLPESEAMHDRDVNFYLNSLLQIMVYALLYGMVYFMISRLVIKNLNKVNKSLEMITDGDLDTKVNVKATTEFTELSEHINITVDALKKHIEMEKKRMAEELEFARRIQTSALPGVFPPFPNCQAIDIFASMDAAKEVGGDFYDFFWVTKNKIAIIIADVSGKGIPAAMFMMTAKTMINNMVMTQAAVNEVMKSVNNKLCESNDAGMFVTCWMAVIDISTGHVEFANAGHNPPLLCHPDGDFEFIKGRSGLVLAGMEGVPYRMGEFDIEPGSMIYLYTDGVTEATDSENRLYGEDRLLKCLNSNKNIDASRLCEAVKKDVDDFVGDAPQFDDITMLAFGFKGFVEEWNDNYLNQNKTV